MALITLSASYGAGGSRVAPALARRLGVPFLERPALAGERDDEEGRASDQSAGARHLLSRLGSLGVSWGTPAGLRLEELMPDQATRAAIEREIRELADGGGGVILGRGAVVVLRDDPRALHVLLDGPVEARVRQAMALEGIDRPTAERRLARVDGFRRAYLDTLYGIDPRDPGVCQLILDSTAIALDACVELIANAAAAHRPRTPGTA